MGLRLSIARTKSICLALLMLTSILAGCIGGSDDSASESADVTPYTDQIEADKQTIAGLLANITQLESDLAVANFTIALLQSGWASTNQTVASLTSQLTDTNASIYSLQQGWNAANQSISGLSTGWSNANQTISSMSTEWGNSNQTISSLQSELATANQTISTLVAGWDGANQTIVILTSAGGDANATIASLTSGWAAANITVGNLQLGWSSANSTISSLLATYTLSELIDIGYTQKCGGLGYLNSRGLDNGDGNGTAADGQLHADEIDDSKTLCLPVYMVKSINSGGSSDPLHFTAVGNTFYFSAYTYTNGTELWKSDGTESGTVMVKDINNGSGSGSPGGFTAIGNTLYFSANDGTNGNELWACSQV